MLTLAMPAGYLRAEAVDFTLFDTQGSSHSLSQYRGKWVVVNFWATWCPPCVEEMPDLVDFHEAHKDKDAVVLGVNTENIRLARLREFIDDMFISYPILRMKPSARTPFGRIDTLPTTVLLTPEGEVAAQQSGMVSGAAIEAFIRRYEAAH
jgi:thiol-disulfide isomerase/thioredoxin